MSVFGQMIVGIWFVWGPAVTVLAIALSRGSKQAQDRAALAAMGITVAGAVSGPFFLS